MPAVPGHERALAAAQLAIHDDLVALFDGLAARVSLLVLNSVGEEMDGAARSRIMDGVRSLALPIYQPGGELLQAIRQRNGEMLTAIAQQHHDFMAENLPDDLMEWLANAAPRSTDAPRTAQRVAAARRVVAQVQGQPALFSASHLDYNPLHNFVYADGTGYTLSDRVWRAGTDLRGGVDKLLQQGITQGLGAHETAKLLTGHLQARADARGARKVWRKGRGWVRTPNVPSSAWRLARTEITASAGRFTMASAYANPFVNRVEWRLSAGHARADECDDHAGMHDLADVPGYPSHPACLCLLVPQSERSPDQVLDDLLEARAAGDEVPYTNPANVQQWAGWGKGVKPTGPTPAQLRTQPQPVYLTKPQKGRPGARRYTDAQLAELRLHEAERRPKSRAYMTRNGIPAG